LQNFLDALDVGEVESLLSNGAIVLYLVDLGVLLKDNAEIILD